MPINKSALIRLEVIDECLRNTKRKWTKSDLLKYINRRLELKYGQGNHISISQLRYDMENMQTAYGAPIEMYREGRAYYYKYEEPGFSIKNIFIEDDDFTKLHIAVNILQQLKGFSIATEISEVVSRIENKYNHATDDNVNPLSFDHSPYTNGIKNLEDIYTSITYGNVLKIDYKPYRLEKAQTLIIHPYLLKEYKHRWYLLGLNHKSKKIGTFALDRMGTIKVSNLPFHENKKLDPQSYFNDIVGVTKPKGAKVQNIDLLFSTLYSPYVLSQPIHNSQSVVKQLDDGRLHVNLSLIINYELISLLLSYGKELQVLQPDVLSLELQGAALMMLNNYT